MKNAISVAVASVTLAAALLIIVPWQGNLDRVAPLGGAVPTGGADSGIAMWKAIAAGAWWRIEPDYSFFLTVHEQFARRAPWPLVSPMGPWAFLFRGWHPDTAVPLLSAWIVLAIGFWFALWRTAARLLSRPLPLLGWIAAILFIVSALPRDSILLLCPILAMAIHFWRVEESLAFSMLMPLTALAALVKSSSLVLAGITIAAIAIDSAMKRRWAMALAAPAGFAATFLAGWMLAGLRLRDLARWLFDTAHILTRFGEAWPTEEKASWLIVGALAVAVIVVTSIEISRREPIHALALLLMAFLIMRASITRFDLFHLLIGRTVLTALVAMFAPRLRSSVVAGTLVAAAAISMWPVRMGGDELARQVRAAIHPWQAHAASVTSFENEMRAIRTHWPSPPLRGPIDLYDARQAVVFANDLDYAPRPVFQSYNVVDGWLAARNAAHLTGAAPPEWILFEPMPIDHRYPNAEDSLSWLPRLERYSVVGGRENMALLRRRETPRPITSGNAQRLQMKSGTWTSVPHDELVWATIDVRPRSRFRAFVSGQSPIYLEVRLSGGAEARYRLVPSIARSGFLLSPRIATAWEYALLDRKELGALAGESVSAIRVVSEDECEISATFTDLHL